MFTILRNVYYSQYRKRSREVQDSDGVFARGIAVVGDQESHLDLADFRIALAKLPAEQREVLTMVGASGLVLRRSRSHLRRGDRHDQEPCQPRPSQAQRAHGARRPASERLRPRSLARRAPVGRDARSGRTRQIGYLPSSRTPRKFSLAQRNFPLASALSKTICLASSRWPRRGRQCCAKAGARDQSRGLRISGVFAP